jgi:hypothetical protein
MFRKANQMRNKPTSAPEPAPPVDVASTPEPAVTAEPVPGVFTVLANWQPWDSHTKLSQALGRSPYQMVAQISEHINEALNGLNRLLADMKSADVRDPNIATFQHLIETLS